MSGWAVVLPQARSIATAGCRSPRHSAQKGLLVELIPEEKNVKKTSKVSLAGEWRLLRFVDFASEMSPNDSGRLVAATADFLSLQFRRLFVAAVKLEKPFP